MVTDNQKYVSLTRLKRFAQNLPWQRMRKAMGLGDTLGVLPVANGGTGTADPKKFMIDSLGLNRYVTLRWKGNLKDLSACYSTNTNSPKVVVEYSIYDGDSSMVSLNWLTSGTSEFEYITLHENGIYGVETTMNAKVVSADPNFCPAYTYAITPALKNMPNKSYGTNMHCFMLSNDAVSDSSSLQAFKSCISNPYGGLCRGIYFAKDSGANDENAIFAESSSTAPGTTATTTARKLLLCMEDHAVGNLVFTTALPINTSGTRGELNATMQQKWDVDFEIIIKFVKIF